MPQAAPDLGDLLTTAQASRTAQYANRSSIIRLVAQGRLTPAVKLAGGAYLFHRSDIERLATKREALRQAS